MKIKDATGKEIDVFTQEEVDKIKKETTDTATAAATEVAEKASKEAIEAYIKDHPDQKEEVTKLTQNVTDLTKQIEEAGAGGEGKEEETGQVKRLREEKEKAEKDLKDYKDGLGKEMSDLKDTVTSDTKGALLDKYSGGNKEIRDQIEIEFDNYMPDKISTAEIGTRMEKAATMVHGEKPTLGFLDNLGGAGEKGEGAPGETASTVSKSAVELGKTFGVSEDELVKAAGQEEENKKNE